MSRGGSSAGKGSSNPFIDSFNALSRTPGRTAKDAVFNGFRAAGRERYETINLSQKKEKAKKRRKRGNQTNEVQFGVLGAIPTVVK